MFDDNRSKRIIFVAHCILNQNSISDGTADFPSQFLEIIRIIENNHIGIVQMPCPELMCLGLDRKDKNGASRDVLIENTRIRNILELNIEKVNMLVKSIIPQIEEYRQYGFEIIGIIGINRSPTCGVESTSIDNKEEKGKGIFIELLLNELVKKNIAIKAVGVKTSQVEESVNKVKELIIFSKQRKL
ncbi:MAG TPA: hypothetical protein PK874_00445 [Desulfobacteraceae bacterium]|nr:hypothetical protein [Desulfobacteraceae bacterium]HPJ66883.1 hypothetical protein [Desulfobacteraceae bacterium]HPQ27658.1 hypothetical protein [Desulfobacteraceae bacterium]